MTLLLRPELNVGEGPMGFQFRLAQTNDLALSDLRDLGIHFDVEMLSNSGYFTADFMNSSAGDYAKALEANLIKSPKVWNTEISRYCPMCLQQAQYWHFEWEVLFNDACSNHEVWLQDRCTVCGQFLTWQRPELLRCTCGAYLASQRSTSCPKSMVQLCLALRNQVFPTEEASQLPILGSMALPQLQRLVRMLAAYGDPMAGPRPQKVNGCTRLNISWQMTSLAAEIIDQWPQSFFALLEQMHDRGPIINPGKLSGRFGHFYHVLYRGFPEPEFDFLRRDFETYIAENWRGSFGRRNRRLFENLPKPLSWIPANHACQRLGISNRRLNNLVVEGRISGEERIGKSGRRFLVVRREDVETELAKGETDIDLKTCAALLGLKKMRVASLLPLLIPEARRAGGAGCTWVIPRKTVEDLLRINQTTQARNTVSPDEVTMAYVLRYWPWADHAVAQLMLAVLAESIKPVARIQKYDGIASWIFRQEQLREWHQSTQQKTSTSLSVPEVATRLAIKQEVAYFLVRKGVLNAEVVRKERYEESRVSLEELSLFGAKYVFGRDLAATIGTSPKSLAERLSRVGINPICGPGVDACRQLLYAQGVGLNKAIGIVANHGRRIRRTNMNQ